MKPVALKPGEQKILQALSELHYATNPQLCRRFYAESSLPYVCGMTKKLAREGYLGVDYQRRKFVVGRSRYIFFLTSKGHRYFTDQGVTELPRCHPYKEHLQAHILGVNDVILTAYEYEALDPSHATVQLVYHDLVLKREPVSLTIEGKKKTFVPDLWLEMTIAGKRWNFSVELDRGTEQEAKWREKLALLLAFARTGAAERFGSRASALLVIVNTEVQQRGAYRLAQLTRWTEAFLREQRQEAWGQLFLFAAIDPASCSPTGFFTAPWWLTPFDAARHVLLEEQAPR